MAGAFDENILQGGFAEGNPRDLLREGFHDFLEEFVSPFPLDAQRLSHLLHGDGKLSLDLPGQLRGGSMTLNGQAIAPGPRSPSGQSARLRPLNAS